VGRRYLDQEDYRAAQISTANSLAILLLWLPGCSPLSLLARYSNAPPLRNVDDTLDIVKHKILEQVDKGLAYEDAEAAVRKLTAPAGAAAAASIEERRMALRKLQSGLGMSIAWSSLVLVSPLVMGEWASWAAPICFAVTFTLVASYVILDRVVIPCLGPQKILSLSVLRETLEELHVTEQILETYRNLPKEEEQESSEDGDASSDYSSANESFLDEDPGSSNDPDVLGSKQVKILVRPKAMRLKMHFELMRSLPACGEHVQRYQHQEPLKYGRLLHVPGFLPSLQPQRAARITGMRSTRKSVFTVHQPKGAAREVRSYSFTPSLNSDTQLKERRFGLKRAQTLGTGVAFEQKVEERMDRDHWAMHADIFDEKSRPGLPAMPHVDEKMPHRGLVDQFEAVGTFRPQAETLTLRDLASKGLFADTSMGDRLLKAFTAITGIETRPGPDLWQLPVDEALDGYERQLQVAQANQRSDDADEEMELELEDSEDENIQSDRS
ncbi:Major surface-labeled trophozoite antigen 417, partial [Durusdinium trenchii]